MILPVKGVPVPIAGTGTYSLMDEFARTLLFIYTLLGYTCAINETFARRCRSAEGFLYRLVLWPLVVGLRAWKELR